MISDVQRKLAQDLLDSLEYPSSEKSAVLREAMNNLGWALFDFLVATDKVNKEDN